MPKIKPAIIRDENPNVNIATLYQARDEAGRLANQVKELLEEKSFLEKKVSLLEAELGLEKEKSSKPTRRRLPDTRKAITHKFTVGGHEGYMTIGMFEDGSPGELFIMMAKEGSTIGGLMDTIGTLTSLALQSGVHLDTLVAKFSHQRFEPSGWTQNADIRMASSIIDYVFRWMGLRYGVDKPEAVSQTKSEAPVEGRSTAVQSDNPPCPKCGHMTERAGKCHRCPNCGETTGCS